MKISNNNQRLAQPNFNGNISKGAKKIITNAATAELKALEDSTNYKNTPIMLNNIFINQRCQEILNKYNEYMSKHKLYTTLDIEIDEKQPLGIAKRVIFSFSNPHAEEDIRIKSDYFTSASGLNLYERAVDWLVSAIHPDNINNRFITQITDKALYLSGKDSRTIRDTQMYQYEINNLLKKVTAFNEQNTGCIKDTHTAQESVHSQTDSFYDEITVIFETKDTTTFQELVKLTGFKPQYLRKHLDILLKEGRIAKHGQKGGTYYTKNSSTQTNQPGTDTEAYYNQILSYITNNGTCSPLDIIEATRLNRSTINKYLNILINEGKIKRHGKASNIWYELSDSSGSLKFDEKETYKSLKKQAKIMDIINNSDSGKITAHEISQAFGQSTPTVNVYLQALVKKGELEQHGNNSGRYYTKTKK